MKINILLLGSGGREHIFAVKLSASLLCNQLFIAPGNAGTAKVGINVSLPLLDFSAIGEFALLNSIEMIVVGPEDPLVAGIHDYFLADSTLKNISIIGPQKAGAMLEGSKDFSKRFMQRNCIPTAAYESFTANQLNEGIAFLQKSNFPIVLKADGLASGKGVVICATLKEAETELSEMLIQNKFGKASATVVIEEFLDGIELSVFVLTDGESYKILPAAKDYKKIGIGETGLNTGGMGSISPVPFADATFFYRIEEEIIKPSISGLKKEGIPFVGFLFIGIMKVGDQPFVIEYNVRMGDPETQSVFSRIKNDLVEVFQALAKKELHTQQLIIDERTAVTVVLVSEGYPGEFEKGKVISGIDNIRNAEVYHAATFEKEGEIYSNGGRVLNITAMDFDRFAAIQNAIANAGRIYYENRYFRSDIGFEFY